MKNTLICLLIGLFCLQANQITAQTCDVPANFTVFNQTVSNAGFLWSAAAGAVTYNVRYKKPADQLWQTAITPFNGIFLSGLDFCSDYQLQAQSVCGINLQSAWSDTVAFATTCTVNCDMPTGIAAFSTTTTATSLLWANQGAALGYLVHHRLQGASVWAEQTTPFSGVQLMNLTICTVYEYEIATICTGDTSDFTPIGTFMTECSEPCTAPIGLGAFNVNQTAASLLWATVSAATQYEIQVRQVSNVWGNSIFSNSNGFQLNDIEPCENYEFRVRSVCADSMSLWSGAVAFMTECPPVFCPPVSNIWADTLGENFAVFVWDTVSAVSGYFVKYRAIGAQTWNTIGTGNGNFLQINNLAQCSPYELVIQTNCNPNVSQYGDTLYFTTACPPCGVPTDFTLATVGTTNAGVLWSAAQNSVGYALEYRTAGASTWTNATPSFNGFSFAGLAEGTNYEMRVRSLCTNNESDWSQNFTFTTVCNGATDLQAIDVAEFSATLIWLGSGNAIRYRTGAAAWENVSGIASDFALLGLDSCRMYEWQVQNQCPSTTSDWSASSFFDTDCLVSSDDLLKNTAWSLFPNPVSEVVTISSNTTFETPESVVLTDISGKILINTPEVLTAHKYQFRVSALPAGVYLVKITGNREGEIFKLVKL